MYHGLFVNWVFLAFQSSNFHFLTLKLGKLGIFEFLFHQSTVFTPNRFGGLGETCFCLVNRIF